MLNLEKIHEDERGEIYLIKGFNKLEEATLFKTHQGYSRGGCIHQLHKEFCTVLEGEIIYVLRKIDFEKGYYNESIVLRPGDNYTIETDTPHYFISTSKCDSVVIEWGANRIEKENKHEEFRAIVDRINKK
jgi:mannose-6-phosphate isomerase-like protein (cupin superfamily)